RIAVAAALGRIGGVLVQPMLNRIVGESGADSAPIPAAALEAMAASHNPDAGKILAYYMPEDSDPRLQSRAPRARTAVGTEDARAALSAMLEVGTLEAQKRMRVVRALSGFEGAAVVATLGRYLEDSDPHVVTEAALGLAEQHEGASVPYLLKILKS